jgi:hypothetical protein
MAVGALAQTNTFPASGNVGIGTTSPNTNLQVNVDSGQANDDKGITVTVPGHVFGVKVLSDSNGNYRGALTWTESTGWEQQALTIENNGNVGIETPDPVTTFNVDGDIMSSGWNGSTNGNFTASVYGGSSSDGIFLGDYGTRHAGIKWNGVSLDFLNASNWGPDSDMWSGYVPLFTMNFGTGYVGIGTTTPGAKLEVNGGLRFTSDPSGTVQTTAWTGVLCGGDYAEAVDARGDLKHYAPGDVLVLGSGDDGEVEKSSEPYSTMVTGIFATKPGVIGRRETLSKSAQEIPMAMVGIVPTKVSAENGPIHRGDLLVSSSTPGYAMKGTDRNRMLGAVIGKAMGTLDSGTGVVEVVVTLQ